MIEIHFEVKNEIRLLRRDNGRYRDVVGVQLLRYLVGVRIGSMVVEELVSNCTKAKCLWVC